MRDRETTPKNAILLLFTSAERPSPPTDENPEGPIIPDHEIGDCQLKLIVEVTRQVLPDWKVIACTGKPLKAGDLKREGITSTPRIAIADPYAEFDPADTDLPRRWLRSIGQTWPSCRLALAAGLPETGHHAQTAGETKDLFVRDFYPLANSNVNPYEEFMQIIKTYESKFLFQETIKRAVPWKPKIEVENHTFDEPVVISNSTIENVRFRHVTFNAPVLIIGCTVNRRSFFQDCIFKENLNIVDTQFKSGLILELSHFAGRSHRKTNSTTRRFPRLPWLSHCTFEREFVMRGLTFSNTQTSFPPLLIASCRFGSRSDITFSKDAFKLVFYRCAFSTDSSTDIHFPYPSTDLQSPPEVQNRHQSSNRRNEIRISNCDLNGSIIIREAPSPVSGNELESIRSAKIKSRVRRNGIDERPIFSISESREQKSPLLPPKYAQYYGIGICVSGSTLRGVLDLYAIRVAWLDFSMVNVLGGALFMHPQAPLRGRKANRFDSFSATTGSNVGFLDNVSAKIFIVFRYLKAEIEDFRNSLRFRRVQPEDVFLVLEELYLVCLWRKGIPMETELAADCEKHRFFHLFRYSELLDEFSDPSARYRARLRSVVQQYDDLRKAFSNATNAYSCEDFCHYKRMLYVGELEREATRSDGSRSFVFLVVAPTLIFIYVFLRFYDLVPHGRVYAMLALVGLSLFGSESLRRVTNGFLDRAIYRFVLGYLVYPSRVLLWMGINLVLFAVIYSVSTSLRDEYGIGYGFVTMNGGNSADPIQGLSDLTQSGIEGQPDMSRGGFIAFCGRFVKSLPEMIYFSGVVFSTLGFGDYLAYGPIRQIVNIQAILGAVWISLITVAIARQIVRR
jgi:hypothetical protein